MKVYLDDERTTPDGWTRTYWPEDTIALLKTGEVTHLSLDHDLGDDEHGTGYDVVLWIEEAVMTTGFIPPQEMRVHSANSSAQQKMEAGIQSILRHLQKT
ncbi:cyclic-phosphate processing receiver domain-containing protein [Undibacterium sp. TC4M20W]|uniref:cyclic-phosphate processing receiver domain-containing protein n=1 Tax=Undibacterium sp. TC4M20W TaxID=3413052 RepID=UPI003BF05254